jgi:hypothetical protein
MVVHVGDLQLAAPGGLELGDHVEHVRPVAVEPGDGEESRRIRRLLDDFGDPSVLDARHAQVAQVLGLAHVRQEDAGALSLFPEVPDGLGDRAAEDVVREHHDDPVAGAEVPGEPERLGDAAGALLLPVLEPVAEQAMEILHVVAARHDHQLRDTGLAERVDRVHDHRAVVHRQEVLVRDPGERIETRAGSTGEDDALHGGGDASAPAGPGRAGSHRRPRAGPPTSQPPSPGVP